MKKWISILICAVLAGCSTPSKKAAQADTDMYQSFYQDLYEETDFDNENPYFTVSLEMAKADDDTYTYAVIIDNPQVAMYKVRALVLEDDIPYEDNQKMMPSSGILDEPYSLIPNQVNKQDGYARGIALRGTTDKESLEIRLLVEWLSESNETKREYMRWQLSESGAVVITN